MLTPDLVMARRVKQELRLIPLDGDTRVRALEIAALLLNTVKAHEGASREELEEALAALDAGPGEKRLWDGLGKLVEDACVWASLDEDAPAQVRETAFGLAATARLAGTFSRDAVMEQTATTLGRSTQELDALLYADLHGAQRLEKAPLLSAAAVLETYEAQQAQGVLVRAAKVVVDVHCASPAGYRHLFRKLKFLRLMAAVRPLAKGGYQLVLDGPMSLFESTTRYGLQLAMLLPHLRACSRFSLKADVRWGKERVPLLFELTGGDEVTAQDVEEHFPEELQALLKRLGELDTPWKAAINEDLLTLPGVGVCVPDLVFSHKKRGVVVYLELLGFWSRDAVWKRVELVEKGLKTPVLFCVGARLRVGEAALPEDAPSALYVFKGAMNARAVLEKVDALAAR